MPPAGCNLPVVDRASKAYQRSRKPSRSKAQLPDSTAEAAPLIQDDILGAVPLATRGGRPRFAAAEPAKPVAVFDATALSAEAEELLTAARVEPTVPVLSDLLRVVFGFRDFRDGQLQAIQHTLAGHACLAILPTGQGKSLCYQVRRRQLALGSTAPRDTDLVPLRSYRHSCSLALRWLSVRSLR